MHMYYHKLYYTYNLSLNNFESSPAMSELFRIVLDAEEVISDAYNRLAKPSGHPSCISHWDEGHPKATAVNDAPCEVRRNTTTAHLF